MLRYRERAEPRGTSQSQISTISSTAGGAGQARLDLSTTPSLKAQIAKRLRGHQHVAHVEEQSALHTQSLSNGGLQAIPEHSDRGNDSGFATPNCYSRRFRALR